MTRPFLVALHGMAHSFIELDKAVVHVIRLVSFLWLWFQSVCPLMEKDKRLMKLPDGRDWLRGNLGLVLMDGAMLSKSLIQFSVDMQGCVPSLLFAAAAKSLQPCLTLWNPIDDIPPGSPIPGILQARTLEWVAISFSAKDRRSPELRGHVHTYKQGSFWTNMLRCISQFGTEIYG